MKNKKKTSDPYPHYLVRLSASKNRVAAYQIDTIFSVGWRVVEDQF